jgi:hypothetical protein
MQFDSEVITPIFTPVKLVVLVESREELDNIICGVPNATHKVMAEGLVKQAKEHWCSLTKMMGGRDVPRNS